MQLSIIPNTLEGFNLNELTTIQIDEQFYFIGEEVTAALDYADRKTPIERLDNEDKLLSPYPIRGHMYVLISEAALYQLVFTSQKPNARKFQRWVTSEVLPEIRKNGFYGKVKLPGFVNRFNLNYGRGTPGYFSVISELFIRLYGSLEMLGYAIPDQAKNGKDIRPDISVGKLFTSYLKEHYPEHVDNYKMYSHLFGNDHCRDAKEYPNEMLPIFIKFVDHVWVPNKAVEYFKEKDPVALEYLPKLLR
ncbi:BRO-N domain-containing protein [Enterovibrio calviensis]|uniref:BRO-N domain-containing protein n=1 Tax=Enterovibrio calviensis TaxID=91359 RepID=UPI0006871386|nr:BRO family protein [Enterovibrio calviensis]